MPVIKKFLTIFLGLMFVSTGKVWAGCEMTSSAQYLMPNSSTNVEISLKNTGDTAISWIRAPMEFSPLINSVEVSIQDSGWITAESGKYISGDVNPGETIIFSTYVNTGNDEGTADWNWETSVNFFGDPIDNCNSISFLVTSAAPTSAPTPTPIPAPAIRSTNLAGTQDVETALSKGAVKYIIKSENEPKQVVNMVKEILAGYTRNTVPKSS